MTSVYLPIIGQGSQPAEADGFELSYPVMPEAMTIYRMPELSADLNSSELAQAKHVLQTLLQDLVDYSSEAPHTYQRIDLSHCDASNKQFLDELLGEGEVSVSVLGIDGSVRIQESVLAGVWRIQHLNAATLIADYLEVGAIPSLVTTIFNTAGDHIDADMSELPEGVMNAPALLTELNAQISAYLPGQTEHVINLSLLPQTEQDLQFLEQRLGFGNITILSRGYGNCRISATATRYVWWVRYFNSQDTLILNTLEVSAVPNVACASAEDIADSHQRLQEILAIYDA